MRNKDMRSDMSAMDILAGRTPPSAIDLEKAIIGVVLLESSAFYSISKIINHVCFYLPQHVEIFKAIESVASRNQNIDILVVGEELTKCGKLEQVGGISYLVQLTNAVVSSVGVVTYARIVLQKAIKRELAKVSMDVFVRSYDDSVDCFDLLDYMSEAQEKIVSSAAGSTELSLSDIAIDVVNKLECKVNYSKRGEENPDDVFTMIPEWDAVNGSLSPGVYVISARPAMGKTSLMVEMLCRMGKKYKLGVLNGEMTNAQLLTRMACNLGNISNELFRKDGLDVSGDELRKFSEYMNDAINLSLLIDNTTEIERSVSLIRRWVKIDKVKCVFVDVLNKFKVPEERERYMTDTQQLNYVFGKFVSTAKECNVPIIVFHHLNRDLYKRANHEPILSDIKGSDKISDDSFQVAFLHRPEYYSDTKEIADQDGQDIKNLCYLIIAKHREGGLSRIKFRVDLPCSRFYNWEDDGFGIAKLF